MDFFEATTKIIGQRNPVAEIYPDFTVGKASDLMVRGGAFYAVWDEEAGMWSTDEFVLARLVDKELYLMAGEKTSEFSNVKVLSMKSFASMSWVQFKKYCKSLGDTSHELDRRVTFADESPKRNRYISKKLPYSLDENGSCPNYDKLIGTLYSPEEKEKLEWAIGSIFAGDSRHIQKFVVLYGEGGTGKSTILHVIEKLFDGYYVHFDAKSLTSSNNAFSTEIFKDNPLVAIQHDGDLSKIEDNTKLNSIVSHETMTVNEKFKSAYSMRFDSFLFMGTNKPVKITDSRSGVIRRLIDVRPTGHRLDPDEYMELYSRIDFELGAIAWKCLNVYKTLGKSYYNSYRPTDMMMKTDVFFNFVESKVDKLSEGDHITLKRAYDIYGEYCSEASVEFKKPMYIFREELKTYYKDFKNVCRVNGVQTRSVYFGFLEEKVMLDEEKPKKSKKRRNGYFFECTESLLDKELKDCHAQYAKADGTPKNKWTNCRTKLSDLDTSKEHYILCPKNLITIDFDLKDEQGNKSKTMNLEAASKWPPTYGEFSRGGSGVHLSYYYDGDVSKLSGLYSDGIEIKVPVGNSALRRKLSYCNDIPIAHISSGLPMKEESKMMLGEVVKSEKALRRLIERNLKKDIHPGTKPSIDFIFKILEDAYNSGMKYDVTDMRQKITIFAQNSTHQSDYCIKKVLAMKFKSETPSDSIDDSVQEKLVFFDCEVFPNLFLLNWKIEGSPNVVRMINPTPEEVEKLFSSKLVGFNCRRYDNHILYARYLGYSNEELYKLSSRIISGDSKAMFGEAYNLSYTDILDFSSEKKSLKKFEIDMAKDWSVNHPDEPNPFKHLELGLPWDQPVPEERWDEVARYCDNDVISTEQLFFTKARQADWTARRILADVAGMSVNDTTNSLTTRIIFGKERRPQNCFNYRDMGDSSEIANSMSSIGEYDVDKEYTTFDSHMRPIFPGYKFECGVSTYRDEEVGEGGYVYAEPGTYWNVALLDIASMHPSSIVAENLFGDYTNNFSDILNARIAIKHKDFEKAKTMLGGKLARYLDDPAQAKSLAQALKIAINSVYGLTSAKFENPFRDIRNKDNIVAKRGALFMINLKHEVQKRGYTVAHIKTDSIKIPDATPEIISFVQEYGRMYGYNFEHEATYDRMCLVNNAVYIAKYKDFEDHDHGGWTATGAQFQHPYVFKTLFSKEPVIFDDMCETKSVTSALYLDLNEELCEGEHDYRFIGKVGSFCPVIFGSGGGELLREKDGKYYAAPGTTGYRWLESEIVESLKKHDQIDKNYYISMADSAIETISKYGDYDVFVGNINPHDDRPPWEPLCGNASKGSCLECNTVCDI